MNFHVILPRASRGAPIAAQLRRFEGDAAVSAAAASDYAHSRQSRHATPRPRPPKADPPTLPDAATAPTRQSRPVTPRPQRPNAAPPLLPPPLVNVVGRMCGTSTGELQSVVGGAPTIESSPPPEPGAQTSATAPVAVAASAPQTVSASAASAPEAASASAPEAASASAPEAAAASVPDSPAGPSGDLVARMEAATRRMEAAARRLEAAEPSGKSGGQRGRAWHDKKRQRAEMHRARRLPPRTTQTPMCRHCGKNQPSQYCSNNACRTCCEARVGDACVYHDVG